MSALLNDYNELCRVIKQKADVVEESVALWVYVLVLSGSFVFSVFWQWVLMRVWGGKWLKEAKSNTAWYFKTAEGEFRVDQTHKRFNYKLKKQLQWQSVDFADVGKLYVFATNDTASLIEFFVGGWNITDIFGRYRDHLHSYSIRLWLQDATEIPIFNLKQYEQRDWFLGRFYIAIMIKLLRWLGLYEEVMTWHLSKCISCRSG